MIINEDILKHIKLREGVRYVVYEDSLGIPTGGVGHKILPSDNLKVGDKISKTIVDFWLRNDIQEAATAAEKQAMTLFGKPCSVEFLVALTSVNFQLGTGWHKIHKRTWQLMKAHQWVKAAVEVADSRWYKQTPVRVIDFQYALINYTG